MSEVKKVNPLLKCINCKKEFYDTWNSKQIILTDCCILCEGRKP